ncbi:MAG: response regulator [Desulfobacterales bacterium]|nr:response regulator [Desulfobacterales bacterium]MBF0398725.1 response regulator [Desulfobacterales bacterium]
MENLKKIMLVDDDTAITSLLKNKLEKTGKFKVVFTNEGEQALNLARKEKPNLIICDIDMPDIPGGDVAREIFETADTKNIPLLFLSSLISPSDSVNGMVGKQHMMSKSSKFSALLTKIESMLNE